MHTSSRGIYHAPVTAAADHPSPSARGHSGGSPCVVVVVQMLAAVAGAGIVIIFIAMRTLCLVASLLRSLQLLPSGASTIGAP